MWVAVFMDSGLKLLVAGPSPSKAQSLESNQSLGGGGIGPGPTGDSRAADEAGAALAAAHEHFLLWQQRLESLVAQVYLPSCFCKPPLFICMRFNCDLPLVAGHQAKNTSVK